MFLVILNASELIENIEDMFLGTICICSEICIKSTQVCYPSRRVKVQTHPEMKMYIHISTLTISTLTISTLTISILTISTICYIMYF